MSMTVDTRVTVDVAVAQQIEAAAEAMSASETEGLDGEFHPDRNAVRRYRNLIRRVSGDNAVTCHSVEHNALHNSPTATIAFGRASN